MGKYQSSSFSIKTDKQGDCVSPLLFNFGLEYAFSKVQILMKSVRYWLMRKMSAIGYDSFDDEKKKRRLKARNSCYYFEYWTYVYEF